MTVATQELEYLEPFLALTAVDHDVVNQCRIQAAVFAAIHDNEMTYRRAVRSGKPKRTGYLTDIATLYARWLEKARALASRAEIEAPQAAEAVRALIEQAEEKIDDWRLSRAGGAMLAEWDE